MTVIEDGEILIEKDAPTPDAAGHGSLSAAQRLVTC
jgi:hypothetical protein